MRKCFLHIGTHKTGTTAIQVQLENHRHHLAQRGFLYPKAGIPGYSKGHHNIAWQLYGDRRFEPEFGTLDDLFLEIDKSDHDVILSSEEFECTADLGSFIDKLEQHGCKVQVIIYFRDQLSYSKALYLELIKHGYPRTFSDFLPEVIERRMVRWQESVFAFDYRVLLDQLPSAATIIARPFCRETSVIGDFVSILGLSPADVKMDPEFRINTRGAISVALAALYRNRTGRNLEKDCAATMQAVARAFDRADIDLGVSGKQRLIAAVETSNRWMDARFGMPMLTDMVREVGSPASTTRSGLDLEAVFSTATLSLIDELCRSESRPSWWTFGFRRRR